MPILPYNGKWPRIAPDAFIAPTAVIAGNVTIGPGVSVWFGAVIRGDEAPITIGARTNVQDNCVLHIDTGVACVIGEDCSLGHGAIVHGAQLGDRVLVGMHATILSRAQVADDCIIAAGAVIPEGKQIPAGTLVLGIPGKPVRPTSDEERRRVLEGASKYSRYARAYTVSLASQDLPPVERAGGD